MLNLIASIAQHSTPQLVNSPTHRAGSGELVSQHLLLPVMPKSQDLPIFCGRQMDRPITLPLVYARGVMTAIACAC